MEYLRLITKEKEKMHVRWRPFHFSVLYIALNSSDILSYASHHWSPILPQKNARIRRFTNNTPPIQFESIKKKNVFIILSGVERTIIGELLWLYGEFFFITSSKENIERRTIGARAVCPVVKVLFAGQIERNSGMFALPNIQKWHSTGANKQEKCGLSMYPELTFTYIIKISFDLAILFFNRTFLNHDLFQCNNLHTKRTLTLG